MATALRELMSVLIAPYLSLCERLLDRWAVYTYKRGRYKGLRDEGQDD